MLTKWSPQRSNRITVNKTANKYSRQAHSAQNKNPSVLERCLMVGNPGIEPGTSTLSVLRSSQLS